MVFIPAYRAKLHYDPVVYDYDGQHSQIMRQSSECFFKTNVTGDHCSWNLKLRKAHRAHSSLAKRRI